MARKMEDSNPQNWNKQPHAQPVEAGEAVQSFFEWMYIALRLYGGLYDSMAVYVKFSF